MIDSKLEEQLEKRISDYIQNHFTVCVFEVENKNDRLSWESKITSTLSNATKQGEIKPSKNWLGNQSPMRHKKIPTSGLWQVNELFKKGLTEQEFAELVKLVKGK